MNWFQSKLGYLLLTIFLVSLMSACSSNKVKKNEFYQLKSQVKQNSALLNTQSDLNNNTLVMLFRVADHIEYLEKKLCGVRFVINRRTIQMVPEDGYPIKNNCTTQPVFTQEEINIMNSYLNN